MELLDALVPARNMLGRRGRVSVYDVRTKSKTLFDVVSEEVLCGTKFADDSLFTIAAIFDFPQLPEQESSFGAFRR